MQELKNQFKNLINFTVGSDCNNINERHFFDSLINCLVTEEN